MATPLPRPAPGTYKFTVRSAEQAVAVIREKLGMDARVLSVRTIEPKGFGRIFRSSQLEVIAQLDPVIESEEVIPPAPPKVAEV